MKNDNSLNDNRESPTFALKHIQRLRSDKERLRRPRNDKERQRRPRNDKERQLSQRPPGIHDSCSKTYTKTQERHIPSRIASYYDPSSETTPRKIQRLKSRVPFKPLLHGTFSGHKSRINPSPTVQAVNSASRVTTPDSPGKEKKTN